MKKRNWSDREIDLLKKNYLSSNIYELSVLLQRGVWGVTQKLYKLSEEGEDLDIGRINEFNAQLYRDLHSGKYNTIKQSKRIIGFHCWTNKEDRILINNYNSKELEELVFLLDRTKEAIIGRLGRLSKIQPKKFDKEHIHYLQRQWAYEYRRAIGRKERPVWSDEQLSILNKNYEKKGIYQLARLTKHGIWGTVRKLERLLKENPKGWNEKRIKELNARLYREYRESHPEQRERDNNHHKIKYRKIKVIRRFLEREEEWSDLDITILNTTYLTKDYLELAEIFRFKDAEVIKKLRFLSEQEPYSWDKERINELENQASQSDLKSLKSLPNYFKVKKLSPRIKRRRAEIDDLIEMGLNLNEIGTKLGVSRQAVHQYVQSRGLNEWYKSIRLNKKLKNISEKL
jgi:hypothetical protein